MFAGNGVEVDAKKASSGIIEIDLQQKFVILQCGSVTAFLAQDIHVLEQRHEETSGSSIIYDVFLQEGLFEEFCQFISSCHFIDVDHSLDQIVSVFIVALKSEELANCIETIDMFGVELCELKESVYVVGIADDLVFTLKGIVSFGGLEFEGSIIVLDLKFLADLEELADSRGEN